jgi:outer membrane biosynthesis protein TonB
MPNNSQTLRAALSEKFGAAVFHFAGSGDAPGFFVSPSSQMAVFNFLVYDDQWKFDTLRDMNFHYDTDSPVSEYSLEYVVSSKVQKADLHVFLPVAFSDAKANSLVHLYKAAEKYEQVIAEVYNVTFVSKKVKLDDLALPRREQVAELTAAGTGGNPVEAESAPIFIADEINEVETVALPVRKSKQTGNGTMAASLSATAVADSTYARKMKTGEHVPVFNIKKAVSALAFLKLPGKDPFKYVYYFIPLAIGLTIYGALKLAGGTKVEAGQQSIVDSKPHELTTETQTGSLNDGSFIVAAPASNAENTRLVTSTVVKNSSLKEKQEEKTKKEKKEEIKNGKNDAAGNTAQQQVLSPATGDFQTFSNELTPLTPVKTEKDAEAGNRLSGNAFVNNSAINALPAAGKTTMVAQTEQSSSRSLNSNAVDYQKPSFPGGAGAMSKYLNRRLRMPDEAVNNNVSGNVVVKFLVDVNGNISDVVLSKKLGYGCDEIVENIIKTMPKWIPGKTNGTVQSMPVTLSVKFEVRNPNP